MSDNNSVTTDREVDIACLSYRHDFGILPEPIKDALRGEAKQWHRAWNVEAATAVEGGYDPLYKVLVEALNQAQYGKGAKCHANGKPFLEQPIMTGARECGAGGLAFQARKKILEALNCADDDRAITDLLGAINYVAAMVILRREQQK